MFVTFNDFGRSRVHFISYRKISFNVCVANESVLMDNILLVVRGDNPANTIMLFIK